MQGIGTVAIDGPPFEEFLRSRKDSFEVSQGGLARGSHKNFAVGLHSWANVLFYQDCHKSKPFVGETLSLCSETLQ